MNLIKSEQLSQTSCATATIFDSDEKEQHVFVDIAYVVEPDGAINDAECIFEASVTDNNVKIANEILNKIKEKYNIEISPIVDEEINKE